MYTSLMTLCSCRHMLNVTWERRDLSFNNQGFLSNPSMVIVALDRERLWDKVPGTKTQKHDGTDGTGTQDLLPGV